MKHGRPKLTELQISVLAAVRDDDVRPYADRKSYAFRVLGVIGQRAHGFDVLTQIKSLRERKLVAIDGRYWSGSYRGLQHYGLTKQGEAELIKHPEF